MLSWSPEQDSHYTYCVCNRAPNLLCQSEKSFFNQVTISSGLVLEALCVLVLNQTTGTAGEN